MVMDSTAIMQAFAACPSPDCLREVINKPFGTRVQVYSAIKSFLEDHQSKVCFWTTGAMPAISLIEFM